MVEPHAILAALRARITEATPDGRYALDGRGITSAWVVSPDWERQLAPRDLLCQVLIGGPVVQGQALVYPLSVMIVLAHYQGERTSTSSGVALTAIERYHGAALHILDLLASTPIRGAAIAPIGYESPLLSDPPDYLTGEVLASLVVAPR